MRILHTESSLGWGGQEIRIVSESEGLAALGHQVAIGCDRRSQFQLRGAVSETQLLVGNIARKRFSCLVSMYCLIRRNCPDIIITHSSTDSWLVAVALLFVPFRPKLIRCRHVSAPINKGAATRWLYKRADHIITTSKDIKSEISSRLRIEQARVTSIPTGISPATLITKEKPSDIRAEIGVDESAFIVLMVATLRSWKGHAYVVSALAELQDKNMVLVIVGDGPQMGPLKLQVSELGICELVRFVGHQSCVAKFFKVADCFCQPSIRNEGVSQSILQAFFAKVPVIGTRVSGLAEVVNDKTAIVVEPESALSIAEALKRVNSQEIEVKSRVDEGYELVCDKFSYQTMIDRLKKIYLL